MLFLFFVFSLTACGLLYLSHRHQRFLATPLAAKPSRIIVLLLSLLGLVCAVNCFSITAAIFAWLMVQMLVLSLLPFLSLFVKRSCHEHKN